MRDNFFHQQLQFTRLFKKNLNEKLRAEGLYHSQWSVMYCIDKHQPVTLVEISNYLSVEKPTISRTVKRLEEQELVEVVPSSDKRERRLRLTNKGEEVYRKGQKIVFEYENSLLEDIPIRDMEITYRTVNYINEKLKKEEMD